MTKQEFEAGYAFRSGMTVEQLHELGGHGEPCDCGADNCEGWRMVFDPPVRLTREMFVQCVKAAHKSMKEKP